MASPIRFLFIDEGAAALTSVQEALAGDGWRSDVVASLEEAAVAANRSSYAVVVVDMSLTLGSGWAPFQRLQRLQPDAAFVFATARRSDPFVASQQPGHERTISHVVFKPWRIEPLRRALSEALEVHLEKRAYRYVSLATRDGLERSGQVLLLTRSAALVAWMEQSLARTSFGTWGVRVAESLSGTVEELERADAPPIDVIVIDADTAREALLARLARLQNRSGRVPVIILNTEADEELAVAAAQVGAVDYLVLEQLDGHRLVRALRFAVERQQSGERQAYWSTYSPLTGLPNGVLFRQRLAASLAHAYQAGTRVGVILLDLDRFKSINNSLGFAVGDALLNAVATRLRAGVRASDTLAHLGRDKFGVILDDVKDAEQIDLAARRLIRELAQPFRVERHELFVTAGIGASLATASIHEPDALLMHAEEALYRAKRQGRNQIHLHMPNGTEDSAAQLSLESELSGAIARREFVLFYQPKVDLKTGEVVGTEALIRWNHPVHGQISPAAFVPILEETGLIVSVGAWAMRVACIQTKLWQAMLPGLRVSLNISPRQFQLDDIVHRVRTVLDETGLAPESLELELTESLVFDGKHTLDTLERLHDMGVRLAVDDFGTGFSSLGYLNRYPIDELKIDRSFVCELPESRSSASIASAIIGLSHSLGLSVVAEGVETSEQWRFLQERGCDVVQGYYCARPMSPDIFPTWLDEKYNFSELSSHAL